MHPDDRALAISSPGGLAYVSSRGAWRLAAHLDVLNRKLLDCAARKINRLAVFMPPRHGKSELVSRYLPAWWVGTFPDQRVILTSYEATFAASWGRKARNVLTEMGPEAFGVALADDSGASDNWAIERREGGMTTAGVGGPITGKGAHLLICDDPVKNAAEAASEVKRESTWDWWRSTALTRLEPDAVVILVVTRWHQDDLAGRILAAEGDGYEVLSLPAVAEESDSLGRAVGEPLWPARYPAKELAKIKMALGDYYWTALYQQQPKARSSGMFERGWFRIVDTLPECVRWVRCWD